MRKLITVALPEDMGNFITRIAEEEDRPCSVVVRRILRAHIEGQEKCAKSSTEKQSTAV